MRLFRHTIAENPCSKHCGYCRSDVGARMSPFHWIAALVATFPLWLLSIHNGWSWYYFVSILAGELLLIYASGFVCMFLWAPIAVVKNSGSCPKCGAPLALAGRHFDPKGSQRPHWSDLLIFVVFITLNIIVWMSLQ